MTRSSSGEPQQELVATDPTLPAQTPPTREQAATSTVRSTDTISSSARGPANGAHASHAAASALWEDSIRIVDELGQGGMGRVLRGLDVELRREVAVKVISDEVGSASASDLVRFVEEAQITAQLEHPNVVPVHGMGVSPDGSVFFTMKLVRGQSLEEVLARRAEGDPDTLSRFGLRRLLDVFLAICQAISYAHSRGVVHRDLKPANVMVGDFGEVLVMDWGVAKLATSQRDAGPSEAALASSPPRELTHSGSGPALSSVRADDEAHATRAGSVLGTPAYMSPEQANGETVDERSDVHALGAILYEILCGVPPFAADNWVAVLERVRSEAPEPPSRMTVTTHVPPSLELLCLRMLEKDREQRNVTLDQVRSSIQDYIEGIGREETRESVIARLGWLGGAALLFAFVVWYLSGESITRLLAAEAVLGALGWFLLVVASRYPLWAFGASFTLTRQGVDRFVEPTARQIFVGGFLAHRRFSAAFAPVFQLAFLVEMLFWVVPSALRPERVPSGTVEAILAQLSGEWQHALVVILAFLFGYLFQLAGEARYARKLDYYQPMLWHSAWEPVWPVLLVFALVGTVGTTSFVDWTLARGGLDLAGFLDAAVLGPRLNVIEMTQTLVFQGTFLAGLLAALLLSTFRFPELLAALRIAYQPVDSDYVRDRERYFLRSLALFALVQAGCLYAGALVAAVTAVGVLAQGSDAPLAELWMRILGPSVMGLAGYVALRSFVQRYLAAAPAVRTMLERHRRASSEQQQDAVTGALTAATWQQRAVELALPASCIAAYLGWAQLGEDPSTLGELVRPASSRQWLLTAPYLLLPLVLLLRHRRASASAVNRRSLAA